MFFYPPRRQVIQGLKAPIDYHAGITNVEKGDWVVIRQFYTRASLACQDFPNVEDTLPLNMYMCYEFATVDRYSYKVKYISWLEEEFPRQAEAGCRFRYIVVSESLRYG